MITLEPTTHTYTLVGIGIVPSVTKILSDMGMLPEYPDVEFYRKRGQAVHKACALLVNGSLDLGSTDSRIHGFIQSFQKFLKRTDFKPERIECMVWSKAFRIAGTLDYHGLLGGQPTILDLKSGEPAEAAALQTAAYAALLKECANVPTVRRLTLRLDPDGGEPKPEEYPDLATDVRLFFSASTLWHWRKDKGLLR